MKCQQPGCRGQIAPDGYCDSCGMPAGLQSSGGGSAQQPASPPRPAARPMPAGPGPVAPSTRVRPRSGGQPPGTTGSPRPTGSAGSAPVAPRSRTSPPSGSAAPENRQPLQAVPGGRPADRASGACPQPGCSGQIRDGYCDICGSPPDSAPLTPAGEAGEASSGRTRSSQSLSAARLGSALATAGQTNRRHASRMRSARIGAGLTTVEPAPAVDPSTVIMTDPVVPENKRDCPSCGAPVGRTRDDAPGRTTGFCVNCRNPFSFEPKLGEGDLVAGQYRVAGCLAHGGLGWLYLAQDTNVSDRWVVLKGLLNSGDADALSAAIAEQRFLAQVEHPLIVEIYNFVTHEGAGYIVMEFVGGRSLKELLKERMAANGGAYDPLPVDQALAYLIEVLPAFQYLHDIGLVYCDFKPDNIIQVGDGLKLIDLGGVRRADDDESAIFGTVGYQAPEVARVGASIESDIYTIGRTLMVLCSEFRGYQSTFVHSLPSVESTPLFADNDSLYRLLLRCCAPNPADRFSGAEELRVQMLGILRETVARHTTGTSLTSAASQLFEPPTVTDHVLDWSLLPRLRPNSHDPQFGWLSNIDIEDPAERFAALKQAPESSPEVRLARATAALELGDDHLLSTICSEMLHDDPWEWRAVWMSGLGAMRREDWSGAEAAFNAVYGQVPGELAPKLALAVACERNGEPEIAEDLYLTCARTDANFVTPAAFGLSRVRLMRRDLKSAVGALDLVPTTSRGYAEARRRRGHHLMAMGSGLTDLSEAMRSIEGVHMDEDSAQEFRVKVLERALAEVLNHGPRPDLMIGEYPAREDAVRKGLEKAYRRLAKLRPADRIQLVDLANVTRKWSLL